MIGDFKTDGKIPSGENVTREMVILKRQLGGEYGRLDTGSGRPIQVLRLDAQNFVSAKVPFKEKAILAISGIDLHPIENAQDAQFLRAKYRRYYGR